MKPRDFVLFAHGAFSGGIAGRTTLQKLVYFLSVMMDQDLGYKPHFYGPYSPMVSEATSELKELNFIRENTSVYGYNNQGFEMTKYDYSLTKDGFNLLERKKKAFPTEWEKISKIAEKISKAGSMHYMELAMAAKAYIILDREGGETNKGEIKLKAQQLGWSMDDNSLENALMFLEKIGLASWT